MKVIITKNPSANNNLNNNSKEEMNMKNTMNNKTTNMSNKTINNTSKEETTMKNTVEITTSTAKNEVEYTIEYQTRAGACIPVINGKEEYGLAFGYTSEGDKETCIKVLEAALKATKGDIYNAQRYLYIAMSATAQGIHPDKLLTIGEEKFIIEYASKTLYDFALTPYIVLEDMKDIVLPPQAIEALLKERVINKLKKNGYSPEEEIISPTSTNESNVQITTDESTDEVEYIKSYQKLASAAAVVYNENENHKFIYGYSNEKDSKNNIEVFTSAMKAADNDYVKAYNLFITAGMMTAEGIHPDKLIEIRGVKCMIEYKTRTIYAIYARDIKATLDDMEGVELPDEAVEALLTAKMENILIELEQEAEEVWDEEIWF